MCSFKQVTKPTKPDWYLTHKGVRKWSWDREVGRTTERGNLLRGPSGAIESSTTRKQEQDPLKWCRSDRIRVHKTGFYCTLVHTVCRMLVLTIAWALTWACACQSSLSKYIERLPTAQHSMLFNLIMARKISPPHGRSPPPTPHLTPIPFKLWDEKTDVEKIHPLHTPQHALVSVRIRIVPVPDRIQRFDDQLL
jgi:hypothetical protein